MTDREALLANILAAPGDDLARLVYADWLREQADPLRVAAGRFLWAGVVCSRYRDVRRPIEDDEYWIAVREMGETEKQVIPAVVRSVGLECDREWASETFADRVTVAYLPRGPHRLVFERGMVAGVRADLNTWAAVAAQVLARHPLEWAEITNVPGMTAHVGPVGDPAGYWRLTMRLRTTAFRGRVPTGTIEHAVDYNSRARLAAEIPDGSEHLTDRIRDEVYARGLRG